MAEKNNEIRLFKVVKELNISSDRLVEFLQKSGEKNVADDLNFKLNQTQHEILLKQFAPEKLQKPKAEDTTLSKPNDATSQGENENTANPNVLKPEVMQKHKVLGKIDLDALRTKKKPETLPNKEQSLSPVETEIPLEKPKVEPPVETTMITPKVEVEIPVQKADIVSTPVDEKQSVEKPSDDLPKEQKPILQHFPKREKVHITSDKPLIPKIELPHTKVNKPIIREEKKVEATTEEVNKIHHTPTPPKTEESLVAKVDIPSIESEKPKTEKSFPPKEEKPFIPKVDKPFTPKVEKPKEPILEKKTNDNLPEIAAEVSDEENGEDIDVIRANAPTLTGLKVLGKIELESRKKKGAKDNKKRERVKDVKKDIVKGKEPIGAETKVRTWEKDKVATDAKVVAGTVVPKDGIKDDDSEEAKRKRKRKRKRKKTGAETATTTTPTPAANPATPPRIISVIHASKLAEDRKAAKGKEKVVDKDVHSSMRKTLDVMSRGAGRVRQRARRTKRDEAQRRKEEQDQFDSDESRILRITEFVTANELAELLDVSVTTVISKCFQLGMMVSINMRLDAELITLIADEFDYDVEFIDVREEELEEEQDAIDDENLVKRDPVITVMGHVDHGKTTLLDFLRKANVAGGEAGGITQHIGAYQVKLKTGDAVTFLDTPGHEAFTAMRARGTKVTDVAIIVVAADDAVMPTTREAISHAQAGNVPMVFAINKMDKAGADPERIRGQLAEMNLLVEQWGGKIMCQEIAAKFGTNVDDLLEKVILESEILELKANPKRHANGSVIESRVDKGRGNVVTMLVQNGTLRVGDTLVAGIHYGKVRALLNQNGVIVKEAGPSMPVQVLGMSGLPQAGDKFQVYREESKAKEISRKRSELYREQQLRQTKRITLEEIGRRKLLGNFKELNLIVKGDVDGSVEALSGALLKLSIDEVAVNIVLKGTGQISESDVLLASASDALIIAFNVRPGVKARELADKEGVTIRTYSIIYNAIEDITAALEGMLSPEVKEEVTANVEVRQVFNISKVGNIAGCYVASGKVTKTDNVRVIREGVVLSEAKIQTLKRYKDDVKDVPGGYECGMQIQGFSDLQSGDILECYRVTESKRRL